MREYQKRVERLRAQLNKAEEGIHEKSQSQIKELERQISEKLKLLDEERKKSNALENQIAAMKIKGFHSYYQVRKYIFM